MKLTGKNVCSSCGKTYEWLYHTSDRLTGKKLYEVVEYTEGISYVECINNKCIGRCPHCDNINEFEYEQPNL